MLGEVTRARPRARAGRGGDDGECERERGRGGASGGATAALSRLKRFELGCVAEERDGLVRGGRRASVVALLKTTRREEGGWET